MFKELFTEAEKLVIYKGPEATVNKIDDALHKWNEENDFPFQEYYSHKVGSDREIVVDDVKQYKEFKKVFEKIIKKYG